MRSLAYRYGAALVVALSYKLVFAIVSPLTIFTTFLLLNPFFEIILDGNSIVLGSVTFQFIPACIATSAYLLFAALLLMTKGIRLRDGLQMFFIGSSAIFAMNILRITSLIFVYNYFGRNLFETLHLAYWYLVSTIFVIIVWIFLVEVYKIKSVPIYSDIKFVLEKR